MEISAKLMTKSIAERLFDAVRIAERHEITKNKDYLVTKTRYGRMMDLGCGDGMALFYMYKKLASSIVGIDINMGKLKEASVLGRMLRLDLQLLNADAAPAI